MKTKNLKILGVSLLAVVLLIGLAGCEMGDFLNDDLAIEDEITRVGVVTLGDIGDLSFNDMAYRGLQRAEEDFNIEFDHIVSEEQDEIENNMRALAESNYDLIIGVGFVMADSILEVAGDYSDVSFIQIDEEFENVPDNISTMNFDTREGSFLAGSLAAMVSENINIGFVGGIDMPLIHEFEDGFKQGAEYIESDIEIQIEYAEDFGNPDKGKSLASEMIENDADVIFHAAGSTGMGVFEAVAVENKYAIGVDANQNFMKPGYILASMMKRVDNGVYNIIEDYQNDEFPGGENVFYGLADEGVGLTDLVELEETTELAYENDLIDEDDLELIRDMKDEITSNYADEIENIKEDIIQGEIMIE